MLHQILLITEYSPPYCYHFNQRSLVNKNFSSRVMCGALNWQFSYWWQCMALPDKSKLPQLPENHAQNGLHHSQPNLEDSFLSGIKQRLLSFIFRGIWDEEKDPSLVGFLTLLSILLLNSKNILCELSHCRHCFCCLWTKQVIFKIFSISTSLHFTMQS